MVEKRLDQDRNIDLQDTINLFFSSFIIGISLLYYIQQADVKVCIVLQRNHVILYPMDVKSNCQVLAFALLRSSSAFLLLQADQHLVFHFSHIKNILWAETCIKLTAMKAQSVKGLQDKNNILQG